MYSAVITNMPGTVLSVDPVLGVGYAKGHIADNIN